MIDNSDLCFLNIPLWGWFSIFGVEDLLDFSGVSSAGHCDYDSCVLEVGVLLESSSV